MNMQFFDDPNQVPKPKDQVKIEDLIVTPYPDGFRIHIEVKVTPFQERPNLILVLHDEDDNEVGELNVIATMHSEMEFTMHLRGIDDPAGLYTMTVELFYETRNPPQDERVEAFSILAAYE